MTKLKQTLRVQSSPHIFSAVSVEDIMRNVVLALLPTAGFAIYAFGLTALLTLVTAIGACVLTEYWYCRANQIPSTLSNWSVVITGLIYGLTLPPGLPLWMVFLGGMVAVGLGKLIFGGLGFNPFNPALVGRAFLQAAFPVSMTTWMSPLSAERFFTVPQSLFTLPFAKPVYDAASGATPLAALKFESITTSTTDLLLGISSGSLGETCSILILLGGLYLIARKMMSWRIPVGIFTAVLILSSIFHGFDPGRYPSALFMFFSGGLMLGAMFMATDMVASPITSWGCFVYGIIIGTLVVIIRFWGGMPEGVMYAILFANAFSPHIDRLIQPVVYGSKSKVPK